MKFSILSFIALSIVGLLMSCNPDEEQPALLQINEIGIITTSEQGEPTHKITEVEVDAPQQAIGIFPIPASAPIFSEGPTELVFTPWVRVNGIRGNARPYSPLSVEVRTIDLAKGVDNDPISIDFKYRESAQFAFIEDFEDGVTIFGDVDDNPSTSISSESPEVFSGSASGLLEVDTDNPVNAVANTVPFFDVLDADRSIFLELDYKVDADIAFTVSTIQVLSGENRVRNTLTLRAQEEWNKVYYNLSDALLVDRIQGVSILLSASITPDTDAGRVLLDNIKLVYE